MSAAKLLLELSGMGVRLEADGDRLRYFPRSALTPDLLSRLTAQKADLLAMLCRPAGTAATAGTRPLSRDVRRRLIGEAVERLNAAYDGGPINWPALDAIELRIHAARTHAELTEALAEYEAAAGPQKPQDRQTRPQTSACRCGSTAWRDVPIHDGQSVRRDCARCDRFLDFPVWHGKNTFQHEQ